LPCAPEPKLRWCAMINAGSAAPVLLFGHAFLLPGIRSVV
jgi:hypothetical protein